MTEELEIVFNGRPAGSARITDHEDGACFVWMRPDGVSEIRSFAYRTQAGKALEARVAQWYGELH